MDTTTFAQKIKAKYPAYKNIDDATLVNKIIEKYPEYKSQVNVQSETSQDISQTKQAIVDTVNQGVDKFSEIQARKDAGLQGSLRTRLQQLGVRAGTASGVFGDVVTGAVKTVLPQSAENVVKSGIQAIATPIVQSEPVQNIMSKYEELKQTNPALAQDIDSLLGVGQLALDVTGVGVGFKGAKVAGKVGVKAVKTGAKAGVRKAGDVISSGITSAGNLKEEAIKLVAPNIDDATQKVLKNTPVEKFDNVVRIAKESAMSNEAPSTFEVVSESMTNAAKQMDSQVKSLGQQKATIIGKARTGLTDFTKETGETILNINRKLKNSEIGNRFITKLKSIKTKIDADRAIDELQDILYKGNRDMTIPVGSKEDKLLKGILGEYNGKLKSSLPASYSKINSQIASRKAAINILNKALGETIDGVATRGAGLVKRFFSPSGTQTKQLFKYIKETTGINLAEDATLAKYVADAYGDAKVRSLLEGLPTSKSGVIDKSLDFLLEKTGINEALSTAKKEGMIKKARSLTKTAK